MTDFYKNIKIRDLLSPIYDSRGHNVFWSLRLPVPYQVKVFDRRQNLMTLQLHQLELLSLSDLYSLYAKLEFWNPILWFTEYRK